MLTLRERALSRTARILSRNSSKSLADYDDVIYVDENTGNVKDLRHDVLENCWDVLEAETSSSESDGHARDGQRCLFLVFEGNVELPEGLGEIQGGDVVRRGEEFQNVGDPW
ncbi:hypothetical protein RCL1_003985 [Eukaryota sp. TZLM3-RCL]